MRLSTSSTSIRSLPHPLVLQVVDLVNRLKSWIAQLAKQTTQNHSTNDQRQKKKIQFAVCDILFISGRDFELSWLQRSFRCRRSNTHLFNVPPEVDTPPSSLLYFRKCSNSGTKLLCGRRRRKSHFDHRQRRVMMNLLFHCILIYLIQIQPWNSSWCGSDNSLGSAKSKADICPVK